VKMLPMVVEVIERGLVSTAIRTLATCDGWRNLLITDTEKAIEDTEQMLLDSAAEYDNGEHDETTHL
jgi:hypothetical protein